MLFSDWVRSNFKPTGIVAIAGVGLLCSACAGTSGLSLGGPKASLAQLKAASEKADPAARQSELTKAILYWGKKSSENPKALKPALNYARNLKAAGHKKQALSVLQQASFHHGNNRAFAKEYGLVALALGQARLAERLLQAADDPAKPDWRVVSGLATAMAKQGRYKQAIPQFERALQAAPTEPAVLNNLAMAYAASGRAPEAESMLRQAALKSGSSDKVKKNLALVLSLQGKDSEARQMMAGASGALRGSVQGAPIKSGGWATKVANAQ